MQSYTSTSTNMNDTTTGMTLRSGNTYYKTDSNYGTHNFELDGEDFVPLASLKEFSWTWAKKVHDTVSRTDSWTAQTAYEFLGYLDSTSSTWCQTVWSSESNDTYYFGEYLMGLVKWLSDEAYSVKNYPNTRSKKTNFGDNMGYCNGIIRLSKEIEMEWNVASHMSQHNEGCSENQEMQVESDDEDENIDYYAQGGYGHA